MGAETLNLLGQVPLVGIFIFAVWLLLREHRKDRQEEALKWRDFLRIQQEAFTIVLNQNTAALKTLGCTIEELDDKLVAHEKNVSSAIDRMLERTSNHDKA